MSAETVSSPTRDHDDGAVSEVERLTFVLASSQLALWDWDMRTGELFIDDAWGSMLGLTREELGPMRFEVFAGRCHQGDLADVLAAVDRLIEGTDEFFDLEFRLRHADGHWRWIRGRGRIVTRDADGGPIRMTGTHEDVTERRRRDAELARSKQQLDAAQRIANIGSWHLDTESGALTWTLELYRMLGCDPSLPPPSIETLRDLFSAESWDRLRAAIESTRSEGSIHELELEMMRDGAHFGWMLARGEAVRDEHEDIIGVQGVVMDITDQKRGAAALERLASRDPLTGLLNRASLVDGMAATLRDAHEGSTTAACLLIDLDNFKFINDSLGHDLGDLVIQAAARRLSHAARASDMVARLGGDEFVVFLRGLTEPDAAIDVAQRIVNAFRAPISLDGTDVVLTASVGIAVADGEQAPSDLLRDADTAMYAAKTAGRDQIASFTQLLRHGVSQRVDLERELRAAMDGDELEAWFQPEVDIVTGRVTGGEALLRWRHADGTVTSAADFIRVSEETGLIRRLGARMLQQACSAAVDWQNDAPVVVRVNTSVVQLSEPDFLHVLDRALEETGLRPDLLCLEFTETVLLRETATVRANIHGIAERGVSIAIDDFGTGYASLSYLHRYAVDVVKIDRRFVDLCGIDIRSTQLVEGIVRLGLIMGIDVIAEGVETTQQAQAVLALGCTHAQGYRYSPAVPQAEFLQLIVSGFDPIALPAVDPGEH
jgi:diguanylate cyclase (GGDEF)-like protein/PAS domain S-box-containing protein